MQLRCFETKLPNLMLKTQPKQFLGYLPFYISLPSSFYEYTANSMGISQGHAVGYMRKIVYGQCDQIGQKFSLWAFRLIFTNPMFT